MKYARLVAVDYVIREVQDGQYGLELNDLIRPLFMFMMLICWAAIEMDLK
jgi:hypothetical protein